MSEGGCVSPIRCAAERGAAPRSARSTTNGWNAGRNFLKLHKCGIVVATVTPKARSPLIRELETRVAGLMNLIAALDDLVLQFDSTPAGMNFIAAWKQARIIVDGGHGPGEEEPQGGGNPPAPNP